MLHDSEDSGQYPSHPLPHPHTHTHTRILYIPSLTRCLRLLIAPVTWFSDVPFSWCEHATHSLHTHTQTHITGHTHTQTHTPAAQDNTVYGVPSTSVHARSNMTHMLVALCWPVWTETQCWVSAPFRGSGGGSAAASHGHGVPCPLSSD